MNEESLQIDHQNKVEVDRRTQRSKAEFIKKLEPRLDTVQT